VSSLPSRALRFPCGCGVESHLAPCPHLDVDGAAAQARFAFDIDARNDVADRERRVAARKEKKV
jgi:hypothetical protein